MPLDRPRVMGIVNCTPDSFHKESRFAQASEAVSKAKQMLDEGADLIDLGGQTTKPGSNDIGWEAEWKRLQPTLEGLLAMAPDAKVSIDTFHAQVAQCALQAGASMINDISGGRDPEMWAIVADFGVPYCLMHIQGNPATMQQAPQYQDVVEEVYASLDRGMHLAREAGVSDIVLDPGFGFGKSLEHNFALLSGLDRFHALGAPVLVGLSRKSMIWKPLECSPSQALNGTTALHAWALDRGAHFLRVHDVHAAKEAIRLHALLHPQTPLVPHLSPC